MFPVNIKTHKLASALGLASRVNLSISDFASLGSFGQFAASLFRTTEHMNPYDIRANLTDSAQPKSSVGFGLCFRFLGEVTLDW